jgi:predicted ATP-dependent serine protease
MSVMVAVCIRCGNIKRNPSGQCAVCHFQPREAEDKARSLILSTAYEIDGEYRGKTKDELQAIAASIKKGQQYSFEDSEIRSVVEYADRVLAVPAKRLAIDGLRWLLPPILVLAMVYFALLWKK